VVDALANPQTGVQPRALRPADLAREHGLTAQAVRNYEREGVLPPATRSPTGYRRYTTVHASALRAYLALVRAHGYAAAREILRAVGRGDVGTALRVVDSGHAQLQRDRATLDAVAAAAGLLATGAPDGGPGGEPPRGPRELGVGAVARRLDVSPATLRAWERAGVLRPARDPRTGHRRYRAGDVRDAELAHLLRRGGYPLDHVATVVRQARTAGGPAALATSLADWQERLVTRGVAMLRAAGLLADHLTLLAAEAATENAGSPPALP
jgi:DNA-binding transcriptional MerR regulator